jgi:hypothetical protein
VPVGDEESEVVQLKELVKKLKPFRHFPWPPPWPPWAPFLGGRRNRQRGQEPLQRRVRPAPASGRTTTEFGLAQ